VAEFIYHQLACYQHLHPGRFDVVDMHKNIGPAIISHFGAGVIRNALDKRDGYTSGERKRIYDVISELASHASYQGISLTTTGPDNMAQVGPFFDDKKLASWLGEMAMRLSLAAMVLLPNPSGRDMNFLMAQRHYLKVVNMVVEVPRGKAPAGALAAADGGLELPLKVVQARLGHASIQMTADTYGHLFPRGDDGAELAAAEKALLR
jgi:hypothetical protein